MGFVTGLNYIIHLFVWSIRQMGRLQVWRLLLIWLAINLVALYAHYDFTSPIFADLIAIWSKVFGTQKATGFTHYPGHFLLLVDFFGWARFFIGLLIEGLVLGGVAIAFYDICLEADAEERTHARSLFSSWLHLTIGWLLINGLAICFNYFLPQLLDSLLRYSPRRQLVFYYVFLPGVYVLLLACFYLVISRVAIYGESVFKAARRSMRNFFHNPVMFLTMAAVLLLVPTIVAMVLSRPDIIVSKFRPELVFLVMAFGLVVDFVAYFFWIGTAVRYLYDRE